MSAPAIIIWILLLYGAFAPSSFYLVLFFAVIPFGALAAIPPEITFGSTVTFATLCGLVVIFRTGLNSNARKVMLQALLDWRRLGCLTLFGAVVIVGALVLPRLFSGRVEVIAMRLMLPVPVPLVASNSNIIQAIYIFFDILFAAAVYASMMLGGARVSVQIARALIICGVIQAVGGILDVAGLKNVLEMFRTSSHSLFGDVEVAGVKRVAGFQSEASAYGGLAAVLAALLFFIKSGQVGKRWQLAAGVASTCLLILTALSTSSTAYVCLFIFIAMAVFSFFVNLSRNELQWGDLIDAATAFVGLLVLLAVVALNPDILSGPARVLDVMVLQKSSSSSYAERSMWNSVALEAFSHTHGLGLGVGSARTSNWIVSVIANSGFAGSMMMILYLLNVTRAALIPNVVDASHLAKAARYSFPVLLTGLILAGTTSDPGVMWSVLTTVILVFGRPVASPISRGLRKPLLNRARAQLI